VGRNQQTPQLQKQQLYISYHRKEQRFKSWSFLASVMSFGAEICGEMEWSGLCLSKLEERLFSGLQDRAVLRF